MNLFVRCKPDKKLYDKWYYCEETDQYLMIPFDIQNMTVKEFTEMNDK